MLSMVAGKPLNFDCGQGSYCRRLSGKMENPTTETNTKPVQYVRLLQRLGSCLDKLVN